MMSYDRREQLPIRIIGGGMTGLTLAFRLSRLGVPVAVHERDAYLGGLTGESSIGGIPAERFYHCILPTDFALLGLFEELGIANSVRWNRTRTGFFTGDALLEMTTLRDFLRFPALHFSDRLRLGWTIAYCAMNRNWRRLDNEPIGPFLRRHGGERLFRSIWEPLLIAKLGSNYDRFAASFIWATIDRMLSARQAKGRSEKLGFVHGRYGRVFAGLHDAIITAGGSVNIGRAVTGLKRSSGGSWSVLDETGEMPARGIVLCVPAPVAAPWLRAAGLTSVEHVQHVEYLGVVCESLLLRRSITPYYVLNLTDRRLPFTGVIEMSNLAGCEEFGGNHLVYLPRYCDQGAAIWSRADEEIHREDLEHLCRISPELSGDDVIDWRVHRARFVQPVHPVGWGRRLPPVALAPGLAYVSTAQIHPWPVFNDEVVRHVDSNLAAVRTTLGV